MRAKTVLIGFLASLMMLNPAHAKKKPVEKQQQQVCDESELQTRIDCLHRLIGDLKIKTEISLFASENDDTEVPIDTLSHAEMLAYEKELRINLDQQYKIQESMDPDGIMASMIMSIVLYRDQLLNTTR